MNIHKAQFIKGITGTDEILNNGKFQVAFIGRSNVGKSSLINGLTNGRAKARTSSNPGKTIRMDFFAINDSYYFVDFPGYGYARRSPQEREKLAKMILWYIMYSEIQNRIVLLIIDAKVGLTRLDEDILKTLSEYHIRTLIVANKIDNLPMGKREKQLSALKKQYPFADIIPYSSVKPERTDLLGKTLLTHIREFQLHG